MLLGEFLLLSAASVLLPDNFVYSSIPLHSTYAVSPRDAESLARFML